MAGLLSVVVNFMKEAKSPEQRFYEHLHMPKQRGFDQRSQNHME